MSSEILGAVAAATGMWIVASVAVIGGTAGPTPPDGIVWTSGSSDKVASHPTLIRRSLPGAPETVRTAMLSQSK